MIRKILAVLSISVKSPMSIPYARQGLRLFDGTVDDLNKYQSDKYKELLLYAYQHTAYYHRIFDEIGLITENTNIHTDKLGQIPILTKEIIRQEGENLYSDELNKRGAYENTSGGSTGEPVRFMQDKVYFAKNFGDKILFGLLNDKMPGEKEIKLWGSERDLLEGTIGLKERMVNFFFNREFLNSFVLDEDRMDHYIRVINQKKPKQIWTYADSIYQLAKYANQHGREVYSPLNIITTAGVLYDEMRDEIQQAFPKSRILNQYGSREAGAIGIEVAGARGIRIFEHSVLTELLDMNTNTIRDEGMGELLITNLTNYSMPLIRYKIGDVAVIQKDMEKQKGSFATITQLIGRTNSYLKKKDGAMIHGEFVTHLFYNKKWVENFQVIQKDYENIQFKIVLSRGCKADEKEISIMISDLKKVYGDCNIEIQYVENIPKLKSGKYQFVITEIDN